MIVSMIIGFKGSGKLYVLLLSLGKIIFIAMNQYVFKGITSLCFSNAWFQPYFSFQYQLNTFGNASVEFYHLYLERCLVN